MFILDRDIETHIKFKLCIVLKALKFVINGVVNYMYDIYFVPIVHISWL